MSGRLEIRINDELMRTLAQLSAVELPQKESDSLRADLQRILDYVERLSELEVEGVDAHVRARELDAGETDAPRTGLARPGAFRNAPDVSGSFFKAPPIIERQD
jgi:aspartyl-tRNA(Asn)/glutamyl-tRNA(Gln) amidotransferase subunit C